MSRDSGLSTTATAAVLGPFVPLYFLAIWLSEHAYGSLAVPSPFWLPDAVLLCALLLVPRSRWWLFCAAIWPIRLLAGVVPGTPLWFEVGAIGNDMIKALAAAWLLERVVGHRVRLETLREFMIYLGIAVVAVPAASALAAAPARYALGDPFLPSAARWFLGDALAQVIVTPALLYWCTGSYRHSHARLMELTVVSACLAAALYAAFVVDHDANAVIFLYVPVPLLIWAAVRLRPFGAANAIALVALVSMIGAVRATGVFGGSTAGHAVLSIQLVLAVLAISLLSLALAVTERDAYIAREMELTRRLVDTQERERERIARELHDDLGQRMALLQVSIEHYAQRAGLPLDTRDQLTAFARAAAEICSEVHDYSHRLHPSTLDVLGLEIALRGLCREVSDQHGIDVRFVSRDVPSRPRPGVSLCLFRIAQEGLHNVIKHSGARAASVELLREGDRLTLSVSDSGDGFDVRKAGELGGLGLLGMRERVKSIGGELTIHSAPQRGTRVIVSAPIAESAMAFDAPAARWATAPEPIVPAPFSRFARHWFH